METKERLQDLSKEALIEKLEILLLQQSQEEQTQKLIKQSQENIYKFYDRYKLISEIAKEGLWELKVPATFTPQTPVWYSEEFIRILGYEKESFLGVLQTFIDIIEPSQRDSFFSERIKFYKGLVDDDIYEKQILLKTASGEYRWFEIKSKLIRTNQRRPILEVGIIRSIHSQKLALEALIDSEKTLKYVSYASKDGIYDVNLVDYQAVFSENYYLLLGYSPKEVHFNWQNWIDYIHPEDKDEFVEAYNKFLLKKLNAFSRECRMLCKDGNYRWLLNRAKVVAFDENGVPIRLIGTLTNIQKIKESEDKLKQTYLELKVSQENLRQYAEELETTLEQLKEMQEQLIQAEKMASLGTLVAGIAHELNNPIAYIYSSTEGLRANINDLLNIIAKYEELKPENFEIQKRDIEKLKAELGFQDILVEVQELINNIYTGANQTAEIVKGLRNFSRSNDTILEPVSINEILDSTLALLYNQLKNSNVSIIKDYGNLPQIPAYPVKISQVFMNLFINAIHAIEASKRVGTIEIQTSRIGEERISIKIRDNGIGISPEKQKHIFEPFFTDKEVGKGTGLGLSISLGIVESLGGRIVVDSEVGVGSTFQIILPTKQNQ